MKHNEEYIEALIAQQLSGEISAAENVVLQEWLNLNQENRAYYDSLKLIYDEAEIADEVPEVDTVAAWNNVKNEISASKIKIVPLYKRTSFRIAAVITLFLITAALRMFFLSNQTETVTYTALNESQSYILPDSSFMQLNKNSNVTIVIDKENRKIKLNGEAYFKVKHSNKSFIVDADGLLIKDIGTAFNVSTLPEGVKVLVTEGTVELKAEKHVLRLVKGQKAFYSLKDKDIIPEVVDDSNALSYMTKVFVFENTSLPAVLEKLHEVYGTEISWDDSVKFCKLTATFRDEKIETILQIIAETLQVELIHKDSSYHFQGGNCLE